VRLAGLDPALRPNGLWALDVAGFYGVPVHVTSVWRSWTAQKALRDKFERCVARGEFGRSAACRFPANRPGESSHEFGLSWDSTVPPQYQSWWNDVRRFAGFEVLPNDLIHAQLPNWRDFVG